MRDRLARAWMFVIHLPLIVWFSVMGRLAHWGRRSKLAAFLGEAIRFVIHLPLIVWFAVVGFLVERSRRSGTLRLLGDALKFVVELPLILLFAVLRRFGRWRSELETYVATLDEAEAPAEGRQPTRVRLARALLLVLRLPRLSCSVTFDFLLDWFRSRVLRSMLWGLPSVVCAATILVVVWVGWRQRVTTVRLMGKYLEAANEAFVDEQFEEANLFLRKVAYLDESNPMATYGLGLVAAKQGDLDRARLLMRSIAPEDGAGDSRAHFWLAKDLFKEGEELAPRAAKSLEHHLVQTVQSDPRNGEAHELLGRFYVSHRQYDKAAEQLTIAAEQRPALLLPLARVHQERGREAVARRVAETARNRFSRQANSNPDDAEVWLQWAEAELFLKQYRDAHDVLARGWQRSKDERFRKALARLYVDLFDTQQKTPQARTDQLLSVLHVALGLGPNDPAPLHRLAAWITDAAKDPDKARLSLKQALALGAAPATAHLLLGAIALDRQEAEPASFHLEQAYRLQRPTTAILNNLAWIFANSDPPQLERALMFIDAAMKLNPDQPRIRYTRGFVLFKLGRCEEARDELQAALPSLTEEPQLHRTLADVCEKLGDADRAAEHRQAAEAAEKAKAAKASETEQTDRTAEEG